jgi:hypothetical protein
MTTYNFPPTSRYYGLPLANFEPVEGDPVVYLTRRFVPGSDRFATTGWHIVTAGERMDIVAAGALGDAEAFWRICDANDAMRPVDLTAEIGRRIRLTMPEGLPGPATNG